MRISYKFEEMVDQRDAFLGMLDLVRYGMFSDEIEIGPFKTAEFVKGIWIRGPAADVEEFVAEFDTMIIKAKHKKTVKA